MGRSSGAPISRKWKAVASAAWKIGKGERNMKIIHLVGVSYTLLLLSKHQIPQASK